MALFSVAHPLDRQVFISIYLDAIQLSLVLLAPLGFPEHLLTAYNDLRGDAVLNEYLPCYRALEECLAKRLFASRGISDDVIAATMHEFLKKEDDHEIGGLFRSGPALLREMLDAPTTVLLPEHKSDASATAAILRNLLGHLENIKKECPIAKELTSNRSNSMLLIQFVESIPEEAIAALLAIFQRQEEVTSSEVNPPVGGVTFNQFLALIDAFASSSPVHDVLSTWWNKIGAGVLDAPPRAMLSWMRSGALADRAPWFQGFPLPDAAEIFKAEFTRGLKDVADAVHGEEEEEEEDSATANEGGAWSQTGCHIVTILAAREEGLAALHRGLPGAFSSNAGWSISTVLAEFEGKGETGDMMGALYAFEKGINYVDKLKRSNDEVDIPPHVVAELYAERSVCHLCMGAQDDSMSDASEALRLDPHNVAALSVRARLLAQNAQSCMESGVGDEPYPLWATVASRGTDDDEVGDEGGEEGAESAWLVECPLVAEALDTFFANPDMHRTSDDKHITTVIGKSVSSAIQFVAAYDAMMAFLLGGSIDQTLGAVAEDCARNACRNEAKEYFWNARVKPAKSVEKSSEFDSDTSFELNPAWEASFKRYLPRAWMVDTYLQAYEPLEVSLGLYSLDSAATTAASSEIDEVSGLDRARSLQQSMYEDISKCEHREACEILKFMHLIPESVTELGVYDVEAFRLLEALVHALSSAWVEAQTPHSSLDDSATLTSCCCGLLEALRLLCVYSDACAGDDLSEEDSSKDSAENDVSSYSVLVKIPIGVNLSVSIETSDPSSTTDNTLLKEVCSNPEGVGIPRLTFRPNAELKDRIRSIKKEKSKQQKHEEDDSASSDEEQDDGEDGSPRESESEDEDEFSNEISTPILARLLSVVSTIAHLCGDDVGAHRCLSASIALDGEIHDSKLKMACLLIELHQFDEAQEYFENVLPESPRRSYSSAVSDLHHAELFIHQFDYGTALEILEPLARTSIQEYRFLDKLIPIVSAERERMCEGYINHDGLHLAHLSPAYKGMIDAYLERCAVDGAAVTRRRLLYHLGAIKINVQTMFGLVMLRVNPTDTKPIVNLLRGTLREQPTSAALMNSIGEVLGQSGDATGALMEFQRSSDIIWGNPMPYLNAARVYQQLGQSKACEEHLREALKRDSTLVLAFVDGAQLCLHASVGKDGNSSGAGRDGMAARLAAAKQASAFVDSALHLSRHISEVVDIFATQTITRIYHSIFSGLEVAN